MQNKEKQIEEGGSRKRPRLVESDLDREVGATGIRCECCGRESIEGCGRLEYSNSPQSCCFGHVSGGERFSVEAAL